MAYTLHLTEYGTNRPLSISVHETDVHFQAGCVITFILRYPNGIEELFFLSSSELTANRPALLRNVFASFSERTLATAGGLATIGQRWGLKGAAIGLAVAVLAQELIRYHSQTPHRPTYYCDDHGNPRFHGPVTVSR